MAEVPAHEHLNALIEFYVASDKLYTQAEADVVVANKRRDEAKNMKNEAWNRLGEARRKWNVTDSDLEFPFLSSLHKDNSKRLARKAVVRGKRSSIPNREHGEKKTPSPSDDDDNESDDPFNPQGHSLLHEENEQRDKISQMRSMPELAAQASAFTGPPRTRKHRKQSSQVSRRSNSLGGSMSKRTTISRRSNSIGGSMSKRTTALESKNINVPILEICKGRAREWYESNLDAESLGLVKRFYQAALGTKTHAATNQVYISSVLLNDEYNTMATATSEVQELYIGVSKNSDGKETLRDRAARALVQPQQKEPVAIFFAPRNTKKTEDVFYGGHWKVVAGNMLEPPRIVKGTPRQCLVKFEFCGVDPDIVKAVNGE